jgi:hypothetical protein
MRNRDFMSDGFLALIATGLVLLFSILDAIALISLGRTPSPHPRPDDWVAVASKHQLDSDFLEPAEFL